VLTFCLLAVVTSVFAQQQPANSKLIHLIRSSSVQGVKINGIDLLKVYNGVFQQDYSILSSDSAYLNQKANTFDGYGHVVINQGDTLHIYSENLNYNGNNKIAILTNNVRMVDKDATLTTNYLTYNTATRIGTYVNGGKLVNKDNVLTSKNGYYFANSRDSYFRYDVHLTTPDAFVVTDTMRYNSGSKIAYFYGPTNIYGKKKPKDNDTLYTENGTYNTNTEQAFFGKKNLYKSGSKSLKGDSLFYDRKKGFGHAINHIVFNDTEQKMKLMGDLADYYKGEERTVVTKNAYCVIVTEERDSSKNDSLNNKTKLPVDTNKKAIKDTAKKAPPGKLAPATTTKNNTAPMGTKLVGDKPLSPNNTTKLKSDTAIIKGSKKKKQMTIPKLPVDTSLIKKDTVRIKHDSIYIASDTLETKLMVYKDYKDMQEKIRLSHIKDTSIRPPSIVYKKPLKYIELAPPRWIPDTTFLHRNYFGAVKPDTSNKANKKGKSGKPDKTGKPDKNAKPDKNQPLVKKMSAQDSIKNANKVDSVYLTRKVVLSDTSHIRILSAFHHVKMFKSDLQGKSDSAFYSNSDSTIRLYVHPIVWTQGSQLSGDTINLQMKDKKLNNIELFPNAFIVNVEKEDSVHFNQVAGKKMRGFFHNDKLTTMFVDGNAETIYFARDTATKKVTEMQRSLSSRIHITFKDSKVTTLVFMAKPEHRYGPLEKFTEDDKVLKGFIWKPKERPVSKEAIIPSLNKNAPVKNDKNKAGVKSKVPAGNGKDIKAAKDTSATKPGNLNLPTIKTAKDSTSKQLPAVKTAKDSTLKLLPVKPVDTIKKTRILLR
jgi:lipopolysaccharide export system protein LptA